VAPLAAALAGTAVVLAVGVCRTAQLRLPLRRRGHDADPAPASASDLVTDATGGGQS